ncbi:hypothetical protein TWF718_001092 [Orbilia javanica]|uniref:Uncharacterized protein n=1 Tax=Orbilia javanica TaxID=47235 RepID=A0AAN8N963_9PEZI
MLIPSINYSKQAMGATIYYAVLSISLLCSLVYAIDLSIPSIRTNSVDNLILDLQSLQKDIELWATLIPSAEDSYNYVQDVIDAAANERVGIFGGNSIPSADLVAAAETIYNTLAAFQPLSQPKELPDYSFAAGDPFLNVNLRELFDYIKDWKPSDENPFPPPDPRLHTPEMLALIADAKAIQRAEEEAYQQQVERNMRELMGGYPGPQDGYSGNDDYADGTGPYDYQDMLSAALNSPGILSHNVGPLDFDSQPVNSRSGAMEEEIDDTIVTTTPFNTASNGQFNTFLDSQFNTAQNIQTDPNYSWLDTISIPPVNAASNSQADTAYNYKSLGLIDNISNGGVNTQATTGPALTTSGDSLDAPPRGLPVAGSPWSSFDSNAPPPNQQFRTNVDRNEARRSRKAVLAANSGVDPNSDPAAAYMEGRRIRRLKTAGTGTTSTQTQVGNSQSNPQDNMNSYSKRRLQLNFKA